MTRTRKNKKIPAFSATHREVLAFDSNRQRPFIDVFYQEPENIDQKNLGSLMAVFMVKDRTDQSSYLVNLLSSVIKKEYYRNYRRGSVDSFEASLKKLNSALAEISHQGIVNWIGALDAVVGVFENNNFHFASTGDAKVFFLRDNMMNELSGSEDIDEAEEQFNPIKTFSDVASGRMQIGDKLLLTTGNATDIISQQQIKKNALRFDNDQFQRFIHTALANELSCGGAIILDVEEAPEIQKEKKRKEEEDLALNAFAAQAFEKEKTKPKIKKEAETTEKTKELAKTEIQTEFVDKKTGHIYIKDEGEPEETVDQQSVHIASQSAWKDILSAAWQKILVIYRKTTKNLKLYSEEIYDKARAWWRARKNRRGFPPSEPTVSKPQTEIPIKKEKDKSSGVKKITITSSDDSNSSAVSLKGSAYKESVLQTLSGIKPHLLSLGNFLKKISVAFYTNILPHASKLGQRFNRLSTKQKLYAIAGIAAIIILPLIFNWLSSRPESVEKEVPAAPIVRENRPLTDDENVTWLENFNEIQPTEKILSFQTVSDASWTISEKNISEVDSLGDEIESYSLPDEFGSIVLTSAMEDLDLIFVYTNQNRLISFSTVTKDFSQNEIALPDETSLIGTYLTYVYLLDKENNQIYRYPRAGNGFGERTTWLRENWTLTEVTDMQIAENIWLADSGNIKKFSSGRLEEFEFEQSATPVVAEKLIVLPDESQFFVYDKRNSRIVSYDENGQIQKQYYHEYMEDIQAFQVDTENNQILASLSDGRLLSFSM